VFLKELKTDSADVLDIVDPTMMFSFWFETHVLQHVHHSCHLPLHFDQFGEIALEVDVFLEIFFDLEVFLLGLQPQTSADVPVSAGQEDKVVLLEVGS
jgi:hypothetical protein